MKTRKTRRKIAAKPRSKKQRGAGAKLSIPGRRNNDDALAAAIIAEDAEHVKSYLDKGTSPDIKVNDTHPYLQGRTETLSAIMYAARHIKDPTIMGHLFDAGVAQEGATPTYSTPLTEAVEWGNFEAVKFLLNHSTVDVNATTDSKPPALSYAVLNEDLAIIPLLLSERKGVIHLTYASGGETRNLLEEAKEMEDPNVLDLLQAYVRDQITMSPEEFAACEKSSDETTECGITLDPIDRRHAVNPPPGNSKVCFNRSSLQKWLRMNTTNPVTRTVISEEWIRKWYPLGLDKADAYDEVWDSDEEEDEEERNAGGKRTAGLSFGGKRRGGGPGCSKCVGDTIDRATLPKATTPTELPMAGPPYPVSNEFKSWADQHPKATVNDIHQTGKRVGGKKRKTHKIKSKRKTRRKNAKRSRIRISHRNRALLREISNSGSISIVN